MPSMWVDTVKNQSIFQMFPNTHMYYIEDLMRNLFCLFPINFYCVTTTVEYRKMVKFASVLAEGESSEYFVMQI